MQDGMCVFFPLGNSMELSSDLIRKKVNSPVCIGEVYCTLIIQITPSVYGVEVKKQSLEVNSKY